MTDEELDLSRTDQFMKGNVWEYFLQSLGWHMSRDTYCRQKMTE